MTRLGRITSGLVAFAALVGIVGGVPWALVRYVGWPLPHALPTWGQFAAALTQRGIPNRVLIDVLAVVVWLSWATLVAALAVELPASVRGHNARHIRGLGPAQTVAAHLVAAVIVGVLAAMPQPAPAAHPTPLAASLAIDQPQPWTAPVALASSAASDASPRSPAVDTGEPASASRYVVQRGDTLWSIAQTQLGDPLRWRDIYTLNHDRAQPDGRTLDSPHWIYPGWTLLLPVHAAAPVPDETPAPPRAPTSAPGLPQQTPPPPPTPAGTTSPPSAHEHHGDAAGDHSPHARAWVDLPSGSRIGGSFLAGVLAALATERLRRRRHYRPSPPAPSPIAAGNSGRPQPAALRALLTTLHSDGDYEDQPPPAHHFAAPPLTATPADDARLRPDLIEVGSRGDHPVQLSLCQWPNLTVTGAGADATTRAWLAALVTCAGPYAAKLLIPTALATRLLPDLALPNLITVDNVAVAVSRLEAERIGRVRTLDDAELSDVVSYREHNPEDPLPLLLAVVDDLPTGLVSRWDAATQDAAPLGVAALIVAPDIGDESRSGGPCLRVAGDGTIEHAKPAELAKALEGVRVYQVTRDDITDLLAPIAAVHASDEEPVSPYPDLDTATEPASAPAAGETSVRPSAWPAPTPNAEPPIRVRVLGPAHIDAWDQPVTTGLRASAYELFAYYLLHPDGATAETAIDAIWPDVDLDRGRQRFWTALGNLRSRLRGPNGENLDVITKSGPRYRPDTAVLDIDLWRFEAALAEAATASTPDAAIDALRRAVTAYTADFCADAYYLWAEADREDIHRRALDAHIRLAELLTDTGAPQPAISTLEAAVRHDPVCEEAYRRLIAAYADTGHIDAATRCWQMLQGRLAELDAEPTPETIRIVERVLGGHRHRSGGVVV